MRETCGPILTSPCGRRTFLKTGAAFGFGGMLFGWANPAAASGSRRTAADWKTTTPRSSARACVVIFLRGGPSHVDTFDLKKGRWTQPELGVAQNSAGYDWPVGLMPGLAARAGLFSVVRSFVHEEGAHERAEYYLETGRRLNPGLRTEIPHIGSLIAYDFEATGRRRPGDTFPGFVVLNGNPYTDNGFLSPRYTPFTSGSAGALATWGGLSHFGRRRAMLDAVNAAAVAGADPNRQALPVLQEQAEALMRDPLSEPTFFPDLDGSDAERYGGGTWNDYERHYLGNNLLVARNILRADRGTRYIEVDQYGWDHHDRIYSRSSDPRSFFNLCRILDKAASAFLDDLAASPGVEPGKSLLDETLVILTGEFGRTVEDLNNLDGRDHWQYAFPALFAGGGVRGGRRIGATDNVGAYVKETGWSNRRPIHMTDFVTTIHSALGIDSAQGIYETPSGRVFWYVDPRAVGDSASYEISPLFD
jgi:hypothetical protein